MNEQPQVLVVDDDEPGARLFREMIVTETKLPTVVATDPDSAIAIAEHSALKVLVLDEQMPLMAGTELYERLRELAPTARAIMLTQEDNLDAARHAANIGYRFQLHKSQVDELPRRVLHYYFEALADEQRLETASSAIVARRRWIRLGNFEFGKVRFEVELVSVKVLDERYVAEHDWQDYVTINAGQRITEVTETQIEASLRLEEEIADGLSFGSHIRIAPDVLKAGLESALTNRQLAERRQSAGVIQRLEQVYELPREPSDPDQRHVRARQYEVAPVYERVMVTLRGECASCGQSQRFASVALQPTNLLALRQTDYMSDGSSHTVRTGFRLRQP